MNKEIVIHALKLFLRFILVNVMCFFVAISFFVLATAAFTKTAGYITYGTKEGTDKTEKLYTHYYRDGDDLKAEEYEKAGYTLRQTKFRSDMSKTGKVLFLVVSQIFCLGILMVFLYPNLWDIGAKDSNAVKFKHKVEDEWKGVKIGLLAVIPSYLILLFICAMKAGVFPGFSTALYQVTHSAFYAFIDVVIGSAKSVKDLAWWRMAILFVFPLFVPAVSGLGYYLGYKDFSIGEKLVYKKNRE